MVCDYPKELMPLFQPPSFEGQNDRNTSGLLFGTPLVLEIGDLRAATNMSGGVLPPPPSWLDELLQ